MNRMIIKEIKKNIKEDYPERVILQIEELINQDVIADLLQKSKREFIKGDYTKEGIPYSFGPLLPQIWEKKETSIPVGGGEVCIIGYRPTSPIHEKKWRVYVYGSNRCSQIRWRAADDGRCLDCEGWGCWHCNYTGGY